MTPGKAVARILVLCLLVPAATASPAGAGPAQTNLSTTPHFTPVDELPAQKGLPDPFVGPDGTRVRDRRGWDQQREYLKAMLAHYQYGHMPPAPDKVATQTLSSKPVFDGEAVQTLLTVTIARHGREVPVRIGLIRPQRQGAFPLIIKNCFFLFDLSTVTDKRQREKTEKENRVAVERAAFRKAVRRGYAVCKFIRTDLALDRPDNRDTGVLALYPEYDWGTIAAWAWGYQVVIAALVEDGRIDTDKVVVTGHSRGGKTALCAGIYDERIAITAPNSSGAGGTASWRFFEPGQRQQRIRNHVQPHRHWWVPRLFEFADQEVRLPFDAHTAKALIAPRALINTHALQDYWANPYGTQLTYQAAQIVFEWLGVGERQGIHWRPGGHAQGPEDWQALLDFCDGHFHGKKMGRKFDVLPYPKARPPMKWAAP